MTILSKAEIDIIRQEKASNRMSSVRARAVHVPNLLDTLRAQTAALEAWAAWCVDETHTLGGDLFDRAIELTAAAGIDWPDEGGGIDDDTEQG